MKINVTENKVSIKEEQILNENEYNIHKIQFDFSSEYTDDLVKVALFSINNHTYKKIISNNECDIPPEVLTQRGYSILGVYAYKTEQDTLVLRYSPSPTKISVYDGSYKADAENSEPITPSEIEQYQQILQNSLQQFQNQYNVLVEETEGDIQAIENELQRKVDEGYFDGEDGFSPIANVIQLSNGVKIEIEDKTGRTSASVFNGYSPQRGVDYWTQEDKEEVIEEATQQIEGKIEEYNENAAEKLNQYNQNSVQKTNDYNTNAEQKMSAYNTNATEKFDDYNSNAEQKEINYNTNASQKVESFNTNANSKLSEYNSNAETKKTAYDENATQKTNSFNTNATNKLTEYNTNHTEKMSAYNSNTTQKLNAFNENATQKTEDFDEHTEEIQESIENLQTENERLRNTLPTTTGTGQAITLNKTAELEFKKPPLPMGNSEQVQYSGKNKFKNLANTITRNSLTMINDGKTISIKGTNSSNDFYPSFIFYADGSIVTAEWWPTVTRIDTTKGYFTESEKTYMFSLLKNGTYNGERVHYFIGKETNIVQNNIGAATTYTNLIASNSEKINFVAIGFFPNQQVDLTFEIQIEEGSTFTECEPYVGGTASPNPDYPQEITNVTGDVEVVVQNKNMFDISKSLLGKILNMSNGSINGGTSATDTSDYIEVNSGTTYVLKGVSSETIYYWNYYICLYDSNKDFVERQAMTSLGSKAFSFIPSQNGFIRFTYNNNSSELQLEKGLTATTYVAHKEQVLPLTLGNIELCKIGDYQDYFYKSGSKWYLHKEIGKVVLDGSENVKDEHRDGTDNTKLYRVSVGDIKLYSRIISNYFRYAYNWEINKNTIYVGGTSNIFIRVSKDEFSTIEEFKNWLSTHDTEVYYVLQAPTDTEITDTTLISQLEAIYNALSYDEQTNISSNQNALFNVEAYQDSKVILSEKGTYSKPSTGIPKTDLASAVQTSLNKADTALQSHQDISGKQDITDNTLTTINKTVPTAINEVYSIARGANQAVSYSNYQAMITAFNSLANDIYNVGQNVMIVTLQVPDLWISGIESTSVPYTYTTDEAFTTALSTNGYVQVGYYKLSALETQKVDLTDYEQNTNKTTTISSSSTNAQYPSAKAVYDYIQSLDGDEVSY